MRLPGNESDGDSDDEPLITKRKIKQEDKPAGPPPKRSKKEAKDSDDWLDDIIFIDDDGM